jgi:hypothetical protein
MTLEEKQELLAEFLERWPETAVRDMALNEYSGVDDKDTFTYWVETKMRPLGSIKGAYSTKFGIYRRKNLKKLGGNYRNDDIYTWMNRFGNNRDEAFAAVKQNLLDIIASAENGDFVKIDDIGIPNLFKWKVASLYSNERLVPIFKQDALLRIAAGYGLKASASTNVSQIHELIISHKPAEEDIYSYMERLYQQYGGKHHTDTEEPATVPGEESTPTTVVKKSHAPNPKNILPQPRSAARSYIADLKHNKIQEELIRRLVEEHGEAAVQREENWVDVKLVLPDEIVFYEVKSASYPNICIRQALGQVLDYVFKNKDTRKKRIVVVGPYPPNASDRKFIDFIKAMLNIEFSYENIDLQVSD